jgi:hypothetical protein
MHFSWQRHLALARSVAMASDADAGTALALMGVGLTLLARELAQQEGVKIDCSSERDYEMGIHPAAFRAERQKLDR